MWQRQETDLDCLVPGLRILIIMHILLQFTQQIFRSASSVGALSKMLNDLSGWSGLREGGRLAPSSLSFPLFPKMALKVLQGNLVPHITQFEKHCSAYQLHQRAEDILCYSLLFQCSLLEAVFFFNLGIIS